MFVASPIIKKNLFLVCLISLFELSASPLFEEKSPMNNASLYCGIEVGSGLVRMCIADVSGEGDKRMIDNIRREVQIPVLFADQAALHNNILSEGVYQEALAVLTQYKAIAYQLGSPKMYAVATDIFRKSHNGPEFIDRLSRDLDFSIEIIDQNKEGELGFYSIAHVISQDFPSLDKEHLVSWDSGNSSAQISVLGPNHEILTYKSPFGLVPLRLALEEIRKAQFAYASSMINPIPLLEAEALIAYIRNNLPEVPKNIADAIRVGVVVRKFSMSRLNDVFGKREDQFLTIQEVKEMLDRLIDKSDDEIKSILGSIGLDPKYVVLTLISLYATMDKLEIAGIRFARVCGNTYGLLLDPDIWQKTDML